ncbi:MAG TPA: hemerythrin domain-containing protein [Polyangiaceae bacterium]|nr:hemerythrin domain-containing protein [Polyangiaceae bacterium]
MNDRREVLSLASAGLLLAACRKGATLSPEPSPSSVASSTMTNGASASKKAGAEEVGATEDLMREHGVIRRLLVVYREAATRLRATPAMVPPEALQRAAMLVRSFGEDYHEKQLEEANIFPALTRGAGPLVGTVEALAAQHQRGREITDYVLAVTHKAIGAHDAEPLARALETFARMYDEHTAIEDTLVFPKWKKVLTPRELDEMSDLFEEIEHKNFGKDGFDEAVGQVAAIEQSLGIGLAALTAPAPPRS